ncbi:MAG: aldo/keto reductase, partial [Pseudomonadota bacterium]
MKQVKLGASGLSVGTIAYGCWRFAGDDASQADRKIRTALDHGMTLIDTADIYGYGEPAGFGGAEVRLGEVLAADPSLRARMVLATKGGVHLPTPYKASGDYLAKAVDA